MRWLCLSAGMTAMLFADVGLTQSICNPCVDPPSIRRDDFSPVTSRTVMTAEDMRNLGIVTVADMVDQLGAGMADEDAVGDEVESESDSPFNLDSSIDELRRSIGTGPPVEPGDADSEAIGADSESFPEDAASSGGDESDTPPQRL